MSKISVIIGTRPEAIKLAPVVLALQRDGTHDVETCLTGQHQGLVDQVVDTFGLRPDANFALMRRRQPVADFVARALARIDTYLELSAPDLVLVQGDTSTVFASALAALYRQVPVGHVEAGLRTGDLRSPWPEEANRVLTSRLAAIHFAPTARSKDNLLAEGISEDAVFVTGNTVVDALLAAREIVRSRPPELPARLREIVAGPLRDRPLVLITGHRRESFGEGMRSVFAAIGELSHEFPRTQFVFPVHPNPDVGDPARAILGDLQNVVLCEPQPYPAFVALMDRATLILTDSGGIQEEAPSLGKPVLVTRDTTERPEAAACGAVRLVGTCQTAVSREVSRLLRDETARETMRVDRNPYGDGHAAEAIVQILNRYLLGQPAKASASCRKR